MEFEKSRLKTCSFFGHRKIIESAELIEKLHKAIADLIVKCGVNTFLFGSNSAFDRLCYQTVSGLKNEYPHIKRIYVRAEFPYVSESYTRYLLERYEHTYFPERIMNAGRAVYVERNYEMIDNSAHCIIYYDEANATKSSSGTKLAYEYARRKNLHIQNLTLP